MWFPWIMPPPVPPKLGAFAVIGGRGWKEGAFSPPQPRCFFEPINPQFPAANLSKQIDRKRNFPLRFEGSVRAPRGAHAGSGGGRPRGVRFIIIASLCFLFWNKTNGRCWGFDSEVCVRSGWRVSVEGEASSLAAFLESFHLPCLLSPSTFTCTFFF